MRSAERAAHFIWKRNRPQKGALLRATLEGAKKSDPGTLSDYANLGEGLLYLYDAGGGALWLKRAMELADAMLMRFGDQDSGGLFMNELLSGAQAMARPKQGADGVTPSGNSVAVTMLTMLAERSGDPRYRERATAIVAAFGTQIKQRPASFAYMLTGLDRLQHGETGAYRHMSAGHIKGRAYLERDGQDGKVILRLDMQPNWHINPHNPQMEGVIPTQLTLGKQARGWRLKNVTYPKPEMLSLELNDAPMPLYRERVEIRAELEQLPWKGTSTAQKIIPLQLRLQSCSDQICLAPEEVLFWVPLHI